MAHSSCLFFYLTVLVIPSLYSLPMDTPLLASSWKGLDEEVSNPFLSKHSTKCFQAEKCTENNRGVKSILGTTKGAFKKKLVRQTPTPKTIPTDWEVCFGVSKKALESESTELRSMAEAVIHLGLQFDLHEYNPQNKMEHILYTINLFYSALENDSLNTAERIWSVGVVSFLRTQIPDDTTPVIPSVWKAEDLARPRSHFLRYFLQDKDLGKAIQEMWSDSAQEPSEHIIQEVIQRESIVNHIQRQISMGHVRGSIEFQTIYLDFINLKSPIDSQKALSLIRLISNHLDRQQIQDRTGFDEEKHTVRFLLHLEEHNYESNLEFKKLIEQRKLRKKILAKDTSIQLEEKLHPNAIDLLKQLKNPTIVDAKKIREALKVLVDEQISISQAGRLLRVVNLLSKSNSEIYIWLNHQLDRHPRMVPRLYDKLLKYRHGRIDPNWFDSKDIEYLILSKQEDQVAKKYKDDLAKALVSKCVLSKGDITGAGYSAIYSETNKVYMVTVILYAIFKRMLVLKAKSYADQEYNTDNVLVEYILHLIAFKNNDKRLYRHLLADKHVPEVFPLHHTLLFQKLSMIVLSFVDNPSWDHNDRYDIFSDALNSLEKVIISLLYYQDEPIC
ncbi:hypothetical protein DFH28DRAFT_1181863 [Melampsora americana]|nr:hypothetical protein DFH28DRAFT_1181863 [Melampsora americana]